MQCGLLGKKLAHSYSPFIHGKLGDYTYDLFEKDPDELENFLKNGVFFGLNVTIPYKKAVIPFCAALSAEAEALGAVNTIVRREDGTLIGHNTDYFGFKVMLQHSGLSVAGKKVLVLGSGGASNTAAAVLRDQCAHVVVISRNGEDNYDNLCRHADAALIVNATPVGMYPNNAAAPLSLDGFSQLEGVLDLIYNPAKTKLLLEAEKRDIAAENGLLMLVAQAKESAQWFTGRIIDDTVIPAIHKALREQMENIILIGMPGSGKSTVGAILAERTGKEFIDADAYLEQKTGRNIPEIFATEGEAGFRSLETEVLRELGRLSGKIIATGGGCVTREENYPLLHQNGQIFCLQREIANLPTEGRPLSQANALAEMHRIREPLYMQFADHFIDNNSRAEAAVAEILKIWEETP